MAKRRRGPEPAWNTGEANEILQEFYERVHESVSVLVFARSGLRGVRDQLARLHPPTPHNPDPGIVVATARGPLGNRHGIATIPRSKFLELLADPKDDQPRGRAFIELSQQWIVTTFAIWEDHFRPRIATAAGLEPEDIGLPVIGDLRHMRNDIAHHLGVASAGRSARCKFVKFAAGDVVYIKVDDLPQFLDNLPGFERPVWAGAPL